MRRLGRLLALCFSAILAVPVSAQSLQGIGDGIYDVYEKPADQGVWGSILSGLGIADYQRSYAVVVGISDYEDYRDLPTVNDALRMRDFLIKEAGFDVVYTITGEEVTKDRLENLMVDELRQRITPKDRLLFYWSGHGVTFTFKEGVTRGFLPLHDSTRKSFRTMIAMSDLQTWDSYLDAGQVLYLLDSCFSGLAGFATKNVDDIRGLYLEQLMGPSRHLLAAGTGDQETFAHDELGGSVFTAALLDGLRGAADTASAFGKDELVSVGELKEYVSKRVAIESRRYNWTKPLTPQLRDLDANTGAFFFTVPDGKYGIQRPAKSASVASRQSYAIAKSDAEVVAIVGDIPITAAHVRAAYDNLPDQYRSLPPDVLFPSLIDQIADQQVLAMSVDRRTVPSEIVARIENDERARLSQHAVDRLNRAEVTEDAIIRRYRNTYLRDDIVSESEYNASHILVETQAEAQEIVDALKAGADFAETAKERSTGPSGPNGGALGWFGTGVMVQPFEDAVLSLDIGDLSPVQTQFGWHVVKLNDFRSLEPPKLDEVRSEIEEALRSEALDAALEELRGAHSRQVLVTEAPDGLFD